MTALQQAAYLAIPVAALVVGGVVAAVRPPGPRLTSGVQHFAAGVVFAAVAVELLPDILHERNPVAMTLGFAAGVILMLGVRHLTEAQTGQKGVSGGGPPTGLVVTIGIDLGVDGLLLGVGFAAGAKTGVLLTVALTVEILFLGLSAVAALTRAGVGRGRVVRTTLALALVLAAGGAAGTLLLRGLSGFALEAVLSFGAAALLYLVTEELLVEAHATPETPLLAATFFVGFLALLLVEMAA